MENFVHLVESQLPSLVQFIDVRLLRIDEKETESHNLEDKWPDSGLCYYYLGKLN